LIAIFKKNKTDASNEGMAYRPQKKENMNDKKITGGTLLYSGL
jgi:hypothetical protein